MDGEKKSNGLRTAVKYGEISAKDALAKAKAEGYTSESLLKWLKKKADA